jgi:ketosteroid isomerase-like protein
MNRVLVLPLFLLLGALSGWASEVTPADPKSAAGVNGLVRRLECALNDKDRETLLSCFAEDAILVDPPEMCVGGSQVFSQKSLESLLLLTLSHKTTEAAEYVMIDGTGVFTLRQDDHVADLLLTSAIRVKSVRDIPTTIGWCDRRFMEAVFEDQRWQMCFSFPCFVESRVVVTEVLPGTHAARLGMRKGDVITHHLHMAIFDSEQLVWRAKMFYGEPPERQFRVLVRRENHLLPLLFGPGEMGVKTQNRFEGRVDTITLTGVQAEEHSIAQAIRRYHRTLQRRDAEGVMATFCPDGFVFCHGLPSAPTKCMITSRNAIETVPQEMGLLEKQVRLETIDISDIRMIIYGDLSLAGWHVSGRTPGGDSVNRDMVACLIGKEGEWTFVGMPWQNNHVLGL